MDLNALIPPAQEAHAIAAHMPVALSVLGLLGVIAAILIPTRRDSLRWAVVGLYVLLACSAVLSVETGEGARSQISGGIPKPIWDTIGRHEDMAERVWMFAVATALCIAVGVPAQGGLRMSMNAVAVIASVLTLAWVGYVGHLGGELVYRHGIGIPPDQVVEWRINPPAGTTTQAIEPIEPDRDLIEISDFTMEEARQVSYADDIYPLFEEVCFPCHSPDEKIDSELDMTSIEKLLIGGEKYGPSVIPGKPDESPLVKYCRGEYLPRMPEDDMPLIREELHSIRMWIAAGAVDDSAGGEPVAPLEQ